MPEENATPASGPDALPPHEILDEIGRDTRVYRARETSSGRVVALHLLMPGVLPPEQVGAFLREARAAAQIHHPHVLPVLAAGMLEGRPCCTTALAANGSLSERRGRFSDPRDAAALVERLAGATAAAHAHGLLHGGLTPGKILFDENDQPLVGGFGLTPFFQTLRQPAVAVMGDPRYLAPEQLAGGPDAAEAATDVWALGAILYELLTGRPPFQGPNAPDTVRQVLKQNPIPPRRLRRELDRDLEAVVLCCLEKQPADRYPSARVLTEDLEALAARPTDRRSAGHVDATPAASFSRKRPLNVGTVYHGEGGPRPRSRAVRPGREALA